LKKRLCVFVNKSQIQEREEGIEERMKEWLNE
jgi:hypothetical protein